MKACLLLAISLFLQSLVSYNILKQSIQFSADKFQLLQIFLYFDWRPVDGKSFVPRCPLGGPPDINYNISCGGGQSTLLANLFSREDELARVLSAHGKKHPQSGRDVLWDCALSGASSAATEGRDLVR
jgi:hypothetical protein